MGDSRDSAFVLPERLLRRRTPPAVPVTGRSIALFRFGEHCNNACPMCSNSGRIEAHLPSTEALLARVAFLHGLGFRRVVVTGGEPTIHPGFWPVIERLRDFEFTWDINTNGRSFAHAAFADRAADSGLSRAIVSLHAQDRETSQLLSGVSAKGHGEIISGIEELLRSGVAVMINCVINRLNRGGLQAFAAWCHATWDGGVQVKFAFPTTLGKGGSWDGIHLQYRDVAEELRSVRLWAEAHGWPLLVESVPPCVLGDASLANTGRSGFGETHYLDDIAGDRVFAMQTVEAALSVHGQACRTCIALPNCPGIGEDYARRFGTGELRTLR